MLARCPRLSLTIICDPVISDRKMSMSPTKWASRDSFKMIWRSVRQRKTDYPKFTDLYWRMILGKVVTGEVWMQDSGNCPYCSVPQTAEYLTILDMSRGSGTMGPTTKRQWTGVTGEKVQFPTSWGALLFSGVSHTRPRFRNRSTKRRWRINRPWAKPLERSSGPKM